MQCATLSSLDEPRNPREAVATPKNRADGSRCPSCRQREFDAIPIRDLDRASQPYQTCPPVAEGPFETPGLKGAAEMQLGAPGATYQKVRSALRTQVMAAAEYDREGTTEAGGVTVEVDTGQVT